LIIKLLLYFGLDVLRSLFNVVLVLCFQNDLKAVLNVGVHGSWHITPIPDSVVEADRDVIGHEFILVSELLDSLANRFILHHVSNGPQVEVFEHLGLLRTHFGCEGISQFMLEELRFFGVCDCWKMVHFSLD